ncbi:unnamed protein product [Lactuca virosa]|uniref:Uncharacterized protein n=1 Tax=Lactuca virosa TaxID=75947 RepID=A0AAU9LY41_9ASTR|nr:unnamed protein product [Lactuca virosa]
MVSSSSRAASSCPQIKQETQLEVDGDGDVDGESGFPWRVVMLGYGYGTVIGLVMGYVMLSTGRQKWFNAIADAGEHMLRTTGNKKRYVYIGK